MKVAYERACDFLKELICNFGKIDAKIHPVLAKKFDFPEFEHVPTYTNEFQEMSLGETNNPELGVVYKRAQDGLKYFILVTVIHRLTKKKLDITLDSVQKSKHTMDEVKFEIP